MVDDRRSFSSRIMLIQSPVLCNVAANQQDISLGDAQPWMCTSAPATKLTNPKQSIPLPFRICFLLNIK